MPYLQNERARADNAVQWADRALSNLTAQVPIQQQAIANVQAQASAARDALAGLQAQLPALQASAASADRGLADAEAALREHAAAEPDQFIERPNKPPIPNPAWRVWNSRHIALTEDHDRAAASASAAHDRLNNMNNSIAAGQGAVQAADLQVTQANAAMTQLNQAIDAARDRSLSAHRQLDDIDRSNAEIDRDPMDRKALETTADGLSEQVLELEGTLDGAQISSESAEATLASLVTLRDQLAAALVPIAAQLPGVNAEVNAAEAAVNDLATQLDDHIAGGP
jgi:chromosome segregation ATPase